MAAVNTGIWLRTGILAALRSSEKIMAVDLRRQVMPRQMCAVVVAFTLFAAGWAVAQAANPSSASNPFFGSVTVEPANGQLLRLSLDDAVHRGLENNLGLREAESGQKMLQGERNEVLQQFLPTI